MLSWLHAQSEHEDTVAKLPDAKPLWLVGCFTPQEKRIFVWQFGTR